ncbi:MAG: lamin tail domain-containing protein [Lentisphaerae bacterium]|nr:lamin tail domain-containing protein [Lentisphaerota bacterium]
MKASILARMRCALVGWAALLLGLSAASAPGQDAAVARQGSPSSRHTDLIITEIMAAPLARADGRSLEFVEVFNTAPVALPLGGFRLANAVAFTFPSNAVMAARGFALVARDPAAVEAHYGLSGVYGPFDGSLADEGETLELRHPLGAVLLAVPYEREAPWPAAAGGAGHSFTLWRPDFGEGDWRAWGASARVGGTPLAFDAPPVDGLAHVVINELLAHTDLPQVDAIELYNAGTQDVDLSGCTLSDDAATNKFQFADGTFLNARGFLSLVQTNLGFSLSSHGDDVTLRDASGARVLDAVRFGPQPNGVSLGRHPDGAPGFSLLAARTFGAANARPAEADVSISEIMFHPASGQAADEYVELHNRGTNAVSVGQWQLTGAMRYLIPPGTAIPPGGYLVVAASVSNLLARYPLLNAGNTVGDAAGALADRGEMLRLVRPDDLALPFEDLVTVDEVAYADGWAPWTDGGGSSLELVDAHADNGRAANWAASDETAKAPWSVIEQRGVLELGHTNMPPNELHVLLLGAGECLVDALEVRRDDGPNLLANGSFASGLTGWVVQGNHGFSSLCTNAGYDDARSLRLVADGDGDTGANRVEADVAGLAPGDTNVLVRARVRWLAGHQRVLLRLQGNWMECSGALAPPVAPGTPGVANSGAVTNAGPALWDAGHSPVLPAAGVPVTVSVRVDDPDGVASVVAQYRMDPATNLATVALNDAGLDGDALAGDGCYGGRLPGQPAGTLLAFQVQAMDTRGAVSVWPAGGPACEALVLVGQTPAPGTLGAYRIWITAATRAQWSAEARTSNRLLDATLAYGDWRAIYNAGVRYRGSAFTRPAGDPLAVNSAYVLSVPKADRLLGADGVNLDGLEFGRDTTYQREHFCYAMAEDLGLPFNAQRHVRVFLNGVQKGVVFGDTEVPARGWLDAWQPGDADGALMEVNDWAEFDDTLQIGDAETVDARLESYAGASGERVRARYRWNWRLHPRAPADDDASRLFDLVDVANLVPGPVFEARWRALADLEAWMRVFALRHAVGDWDGYGYRRGKNAYLYVPDLGPARLLLWDLDYGLGVPSGDFPNHSLLDIEDPVLRQRLFAYPRFGRAYWRGLQDVIDGPFLPERAAARLDAWRAGLATNGVAVADPAEVKTWIALRRAYIAGQLAGRTDVAFQVTTAGFNTTGELAVVSGAAPVSVVQITVNGAPYAETWDTETAWSVRVPLLPGTNRLSLAGVDGRGRVVGTGAVVVVSAAMPAPGAAGSVLINEIMYHPTAAGGGFVELYNRSTSQAFDLSGYRLDGVDFTFPAGTRIAPQQYLVVAEGAAAYARQYTNAEALAGAYAGTLDSGGETLRLLQPDGTNWVLIDRVDYDDASPWPAGADGGGASLQLVDVAQDNNRAGNWRADLPAQTGGWSFRAFTGTISNLTPLVLGQAQVRFYLDGAGEAYVDSVALVPGKLPEAGVNALTNGGFESVLAGTWTAAGNHAGSTRDEALVRAGTGSLHVVASGAGGAGHAVTQARPMAGQGGQTYTLSFWCRGVSPSHVLTAELTLSSIGGRVTEGPVSAAPFTPGQPNAAASAWAELPALGISEVMPDNRATVADNHGDFDPWIEVYNGGRVAVDLAACRLSNDETDLERWTFPAGTTLGAGERLVVWADGEPAESAPGFPHASFRLSPVTGVVTLARAYFDRLQWLDALHYANVGPDASFGSYPDGDGLARQVFATPTPGAPNSPAAPVVQVTINEWMARNRTGLRDPTDGRAEDWLELFNASSEPAYLAGYRLSDDPETPGRFVLPLGTVVPPHGFLLIWADGDVATNGPGVDVHATFSLDGDGEALTLSAPSGGVVDAVDFGLQAVDVSEGRWPDGAAAVYAMAPSTPGSSNAVLRFVAGTGATNGGFAVVWAAESGRVYRVESSTNLVFTNWVPVGAVTAPGAVATLLDTNAGALPRRFYRLWPVE